MNTSRSEILYTPEAATEVAPKRIRLSRSKGWRKPEGAVVVSRPSKWGNPWAVGSPSPWAPYAPLTRQGAVDVFRYTISCGETVEGSPFGYRTNPEFDYICRTELAGRDLACWCPLDEPCHADVLLAVANPGLDLGATAPPGVYGSDLEPPASPTGEKPAP